MALTLGEQSMCDGCSGDGAKQPCSHALEQNRIDCSCVGSLIATKADH